MANDDADPLPEARKLTQTKHRSAPADSWRTHKAAVSDRNLSSGESAGIGSTASSLPPRRTPVANGNHRRRKLGPSQL